MSGLYCVKCKSRTPTSNLRPGMINGRRRVTGTCSECGTKKSQFVKGNGLFSSLGSIVKGAAKKFGPAAIDALTGLAKDKLGSSNNKILKTIGNLGVLDAAGDAAKGGLSGLGLRRAGRIRVGGRVRIPGAGARRMVMRY